MDPNDQAKVDELSLELDKLIKVKAQEFKTKQEEIIKSAEHKKGKTLNGFLDFTNFYTTNASTVNRSLALGGIAIIWIFKKSETTHEIQKGLLNTPLLFLASSLALDLFQYFFAAIAWKIFYERKYWLWKNTHSYENAYAHDITAPNYISVPVYILWFVKIICMIVAYCCIILFLKNQL